MNADVSVENGELQQQQIDFYNRQGYLVAPGLISPREIEALKAETAAIFRGERGAVEGLMPVAPGEPDSEVLKKYIAIHFPHKLSPVISGFLQHPGIVKILTAIISPNVKCMQSMLFVKAPGKKGQSWHQDEYYIPTRDRSLTGAWIAIDDATIENGCLWIIPGRPGYMMCRVPYNGIEYADVDTVDVEALGEQAIPVEVKAGSVVFFNGYTLHSSRANKTGDCFRTALVNHYMSAESMLPWDQDGKLPPTEDLRDIIMVAGSDPYAWKGTADANIPYLRPEVLKIKVDPS
ncbi:phytanoyl-CoA dioxygenase family protein [Niabella drilacis]|uniref:Ectoine hydroxylase-related dioxygenase, phytanoyl-CoA dioxygenase (PhyH) family n=1 Tax=Niabella drilacis (strain DSM 25811 / CCM 8410 / CCUG 62505 / LMG 26954 / E90) TaxID=1285928 RepID=A0A1G6X556_NIADE|nr:phytanoyl-CoA dioxygenase family protein [Niabella drilacis]SDD72983.1 Ectoine hydroxylase-related dioxygenase, phytanoyl-CoA dioxygenase (PhyH) family [Niabella drilacis]